MTGLMTALRLTKLYPDRRIVVFDRSPRLGGMYGSVSYPDGIVFDHGMHVIYESCNADVDDLYREVMGEEDWHIYEGNEKDIAGLWFRGRLQTFSHYMDLRTFPASQRQEFVGDLFLNLEQPPVTAARRAIDFLRGQFGNTIVEQVHEPMLRGLYGTEPGELDVFAVKATALERVILFDTDLMSDLLKSDRIRARIAFPDQLNLPPYRTNSQKALYPRQFGMDHFIDRLRERLESLGVEILPGHRLDGIDRADTGVDSIALRSPADERVELAVDHLIWTIGWPGLAHTLGIDMSDLRSRRGPRIAFVNLMFDRPPAMDRLYYFYCYDPGFAAFRVTNYSNYCPAAAGMGGYPCFLRGRANSGG